MAKGQKIGSLFYDIDGDESKLLQKLEKAKNEAVKIEEIFKNVKMDFGGSKISTDIQKAQIAADKLAISRDKVSKAAMESARAEGLAEKAIAEANNVKSQGLILDQRRSTEAAKTSLTLKRAGDVELNTLLKQEQAKRKALLDEERLAGLRKKNALIGAQGQKDLATAYGLTNKTMFNQKNLLQQLSSAAGIYFSIYQAGAFVKELAMVSGEFEKQRISLQAIIQDSEAANKIFNQIKDLAIYSPFNFKELTDYAKQLSAFSIPTNEIFSTMKNLADISAGLGVDMNRIILAYGQVRSASVLRGQELRQFTEAGIPLVDELAKKFHQLNGEVVTAGDVFDKISNREVPFAMIKEIFEDMTSEGGKFFNMQEIQATSLAGKISNLRDAYDIMLDSIGSANSGILKGTVDGLVNVMDNWEKYWNILKGILITYGTYKTSIILGTQALTLYAKAQKLYATYVVVSSVSGAKFASVIDLITGKFKALDTVSKTTLIGGVLAAITAIGYAIYTAHENANKLEKSLSKSMSELKSSADASVMTMDNLLYRLKNAVRNSTEWNNVIKQINGSYGEYLPSLIKESEAYEDIEKKLKSVTAAIYEKARAQSYSRSIEIVEDELKTSLSEAYDSALKALTTKRFAGLDQFILSKEDADAAIKKIFEQIRTSPELYKEKQNINKLISEIFSEAYGGRNIDTSIGGLLNINQLKGLFEGVYEYADAWNEAGEALDNAKAKNDVLFSDSSNTYIKEIDNINKKYNQLDNELNKRPLSDSLNIDEERANNTKKKLEEMLAVYQKFGQIKLADETKAQLDSLTSNLSYSSTRINKEIDKLNIGEDLKDKIRVTDVTKDFKTIKESAVDALEEIQKQFDQMMKAPSLFDPKDVEATKTTLGLYKSFVEILGGADKKKGGSNKDSFTEKLKDQVDLIKQAKSEYDKLLKSMSASDAADKVTSQKAYSGISAADLTDEGYLKYLESQLKKIENRNTESAKNTKKSWEKEMATINLDGISKSAKNEFDKIEKYLSTYKDQYDLYETLFDVTGDKTLSMKVAFGDVSETVKSYREALKNELDKTTDPELKKKLQGQLDSAEWVDKEKTAKLLSDTLKAYQTTKDKKAAIDRKYDAELTMLESLDPSEENDARIDLLKQKWVAALNEIENESLKLNPLYRQLFGDISSYGARALAILISKTKEVVNSAKKNDDGTYNIAMDGTELNVSETDYTRLLTQLGKLEEEANKDPFSLLAASLEAYLTAEDEVEKSKALKGIIAGIAAIADLAANVAGNFSDMFDALGNDSMSDAMGTVEGVLSSVSNIGQGFVKGGIVGGIGAALGEVANWVGKIAGNHDAKLDKAIQKSQLEVKKLGYAYEELERTVSRQLGSVTKSQAKAMYENQQKQIVELESQLENERKKKKKSDSAIMDYQAQIAEAKDALKYFAEDLFDEQFDFNLKNIADKISSALVDAFSKGESAAKAFDDTVSQIMKDMAQQMISLEVIQPALDKIRTYLFGSNGVFKDGVLTTGEFAGLTQEMVGLKESVGRSKEMWDLLSEAAQDAGLNLNESMNQDTLSKGIQAVTEDTANLLASYLNAMRADVSAQRIMMSTLMQLSQTNSDTFANMYAELVRIQVNTLRTANNTEKNVELVTEIKNILKNVSTRGSGMSINV